MSASGLSESGFAILRNVSDVETIFESDKSAKIIKAVCASSRIKERCNADASASGSLFVGGNKPEKIAA